MSGYIPFGTEGVRITSMSRSRNGMGVVIAFRRPFSPQGEEVLLPLDEVRNRDIRVGDFMTCKVNEKTGKVSLGRVLLECRLFDAEAFA